jgi:hypothetical protein
MQPAGLAMLLFAHWRSGSAEPLRYRFAWKATLLALGSRGRAEDRRAGWREDGAPLRRMVENPDNPRLPR